MMDNIKKVLSPVKQLSIDESMIPWRGRLQFRQYIKNKKHKYGIKVYELTTYDGFILNTRIYVGKGMLQEEGGGAHTSKVVKDLVKDYTSKGHEIYLDNFYTSVPLAEYLLKQRTLMVGTLRENRKGNPMVLMQQKLKKGETSWKRKGSVLVTRWRDKRLVTMISTRHKHEIKEIEGKRGGKKMKPRCVVDYNCCMSGIDRADQMLSYYSTPRKTIRWYRKVFFHIVDICLWNAFYIYVKEKGLRTTEYLKFREEVIEELIQTELVTSRKAQGMKSNFHYLEPVPATEKDKYAMKRCRMCSKNKITKKSRYHCQKCPSSPGICVHPCFKLWHDDKEGVLT